MDCDETQVREWSWPGVNLGVLGDHRLVCPAMLMMSLFVSLFLLGSSSRGNYDLHKFRSGSRSPHPSDIRDSIVEDGGEGPHQVWFPQLVQPRQKKQGNKPFRLRLYHDADQFSQLNKALNPCHVVLAARHQHLPSNRMPCILECWIQLQRCYIRMLTFCATFTHWSFRSALMLCHFIRAQQHSSGPS